MEVTGVSGNAAKSGIKVGDTVIYTSRLAEDYFIGRDAIWHAAGGWKRMVGGGLERLVA